MGRYAVFNTEVEYKFALGGGMASVDWVRFGSLEDSLYRRYA